jgi:hypothetical protein
MRELGSSRHEILRRLLKERRCPRPCNSLTRWSGSSGSVGTSASDELSASPHGGVARPRPWIRSRHDRRPRPRRRRNEGAKGRDGSSPRVYGGGPHHDHRCGTDCARRLIEPKGPGPGASHATSVLPLTLHCATQSEVVRELIATLIIAAASRGELDPVRLRMVAVAGFATRGLRGPATSATPNVTNGAATTVPTLPAKNPVQSDRTCDMRLATSHLIFKLHDTCFFLWEGNSIFLYAYNVRK